jgi:hypothetical protein
MTIAAVLAFVSAVAVRLKPERDAEIERLTRERDEARAQVKSLRRELEGVRQMRPQPHELLDRAMAQVIIAHAAQAQQAQMNQQAQHLAAYQHGLQNQSQLAEAPFCNCVPSRGDFLLGQIDSPQ